MIGKEGSGGMCTNVVLEGDWTIDRANELKGILIEALDSGDHLVLDVRKVTGMDLSILQLLCSAHRESVELEKHLSLTGNEQQVFLGAVEEAGYARSFGCYTDPDKRCLWCAGAQQ